MTKIKDIVAYLDEELVPAYQESYDNSGWLVGDSEREVRGVLTTVDVTPDVVEEATGRGCNLIISHHPLIFSGAKRITDKSETGRMLLKLIERGIAVYAAHTNFDNLANGVNRLLTERIGIKSCRILRPQQDVIKKLVVYVPREHSERLREALFAAGAGRLGNYESCSYNMEGEGTFRAMEGSDPYCGKIGEMHTERESRIEVLYEGYLEKKILKVIEKEHPYEEPAYDMIPISNRHQGVGAGMIGELEEPMDIEDYLRQVKAKLHIPYIRHSRIEKREVRTVAVCGGAGSFLIGDAMEQGADLYLTGDLKYHDFQRAEGRIILADIGHYESEQYAKEYFYSLISKKFSNFACLISSKDRGYVSYI